MTEEKDIVNEGLNTLVFSNDKFGNIRTAVLDNNPWFAGKDVAECLEYKKYKRRSCKTCRCRRQTINPKVANHDLRKCTKQRTHIY